MLRTTWREQIAAAAEEVGDTGEIISVTPSQEILDAEFTSSSGSSLGSAFTAWTRDWVYFPVVYNGMEWAGCAPRHPCGHVTQHQGGQ